MNAERSIAVERPLEPYPGLRPFEASEWSIFFGRERMIDEVIERLALNGLVLIHGASGSGKSSLVRAGVMPKLARQHQRRGSPWVTCAMRPSGGPLWNLAIEFARLEGRADDLNRVAAIAGQFNARGASLASVAGGLDGLAGKGLCVLVDQFEELFRFEKQTSREEAEVFADLIARAAAGESPSVETDVHVVVTMRSEYLGECARFDGLAETINQTQYLVPRMDDDALMRAVRRPATLFGGFVDEDLARRLIGPVRGRVDELPLLQHGLMMLWREAVGRTTPDGRVTLDGASVEKAGGLAGLLSGHADAVMGAVAPDPASQRLVERVFRELTDVNAEGSAIRRPRRLADLAAAAGASPGQLRPILDAFRGAEVAFLTPYAPAPIDAATEIDISHEALIRCWRRVASSKDGWLKQEFDDGLAWRSLLVEARGFEKDPQRVLSAAATKDRSKLYAMHNEPWSQRYGGGWPLVGGLLDASREAAARARRKASLTMASIAGLAVVAIISAGFMAVALRQQRVAVAAERAEQARLEEAVTLEKAQEESLKQAVARETAAVALAQSKEASLQEALTREKVEEARLVETNEQAATQITLTGMLLLQLTHSGQKCPLGITAEGGLVEKATIAAERGNGNASYMLGMLFECGLGVPQDNVKALAWHEKAAAAGNALAMFVLGDYYQRGQVVGQNFVKARDWYQKGAAAGNAEAMTNLGNLYVRGRGVPKDDAKAHDLFEAAAAAGQPIAMQDLGYDYELGRGVAQNYGKARDWYEKAAAAGDAHSKFRLGHLYLVGKGVLKDDVKARTLYGEAADAGDEIARRDLANFAFLTRIESMADADRAGNHRQATQLSAELARDIEADEVGDVGKPGLRTAVALGSMAWKELLVGDYSGALDASVRAHNLAPDQIWIETNRAHALMLLGRLAEARDLYVSHRGDEDIDIYHTSWPEAVLADFADLRRAGLTNPLMEEIEADFEAGAK